MEPKELYNQKLLTLATVVGLIGRIRGELANLSTIEDRFPDPDHGDLFELNTTLDELEARVGELAAGVKPLARG
jgi:hypothetical protein